MPAQHKNTVYKTVESENPFLEGQDKAYAEILLDNQKDKTFWRNIVGPGVLILSFLNLCLFYYSVKQQKTIPVLINVMPSGEARYLGEVRQAQIPVPESAIVFQVRTFLTNLRSVSTDHQVLYNNINDCYGMVTNSYEPIMTRTLREASPFDLVGKVRRGIEIESVIKITSETYQADWLEVTLEGSVRRNARMRALITIKLLPVSDETIKRNPLGIYIDNCEMTEL